MDMVEYVLRRVPSSKSFMPRKGLLRMRMGLVVKNGVTGLRLKQYVCVHGENRVQCTLEYFPHICT